MSHLFPVRRKPFQQLARGMRSARPERRPAPVASPFSADFTPTCGIAPPFKALAELCDTCIGPSRDRFLARGFKGNRVNARAAPATVSGEPRITSHWDVPSGLTGKAVRQAMTREPGDLPVAVVFRRSGDGPLERSIPVGDVLGPCFGAAVTPFRWTVSNIVETSYETAFKIVLDRIGDMPRHCTICSRPDRPCPG